MGVRSIKVLCFLFLLLIFINGVHADNPTLKWTKRFDDKTGLDITSTYFKETNSQCTIKSVSISQNGDFILAEGQFIGTAKHVMKTYSKSGNMLHEDFFPYTINIFESHPDRFIWDSDTLITTTIPSNLLGVVYNYEINGTTIKTNHVNGKLWIKNLIVSQDGKYISIIDGNKKVSLFDSNANLLVSGTYDGSGNLLDSAISNNGDIVVVSDDGRLILFDKTGAEIFRNNIDFRSGFVKISPDGKRIAVYNYNHNKEFFGIAYYDNSGEELWKKNKFIKEQNYPINDLEIRYNNNYYLAYIQKNDIEIINDQGELVGNYSFDEYIERLSISEEGNYILVSTGCEYLYYLENIQDSKHRIVILANSIDYSLASDFFSYLKNKNMNIVHATSVDFEQYKNEKFVVILGGPDAPEGVGEIVQEVLDENEQNQIREKGNRKMYANTNTWDQGQSIVVIAGSNREETKNAEDENKGLFTTS